jgi:PAS domain S-box-containing protein
MTAFLALCFLAGYVILDAYYFRNKLRGLNSTIDSLRHFAGRAREMQDLWYEETGDGFMLVGSDGNIHSMNPAARRLAGAPTEPVAGRPLTAFLKPECEVLRAVQGALLDGQPVRRRAVKVRPVRTTEASREMSIKVVEVAGRREAWVLLGMG